MLSKLFKVICVLSVCSLLSPMASAVEYRYNMGPAANDPCYVDVVTTVYNVSDGYGWTYRIVSGALDEYNALFRTRGVNSDPVLDTVILENRAPGVGNPATDSRAYTLRFDVPNGVYTVTLTIGDEIVKSDDTFVIGQADDLTESVYGDFLKLDDPNVVSFDSGVVQAGKHVAYESVPVSVDSGRVYVGWGRKLGTIEWGTVNSIVITEDLPPQTCQEALDDGFSLTHDFNSNCVVDLADFGMFAGEWLRCIDPEIAGCEHPWE